MSTSRGTILRGRFGPKDSLPLRTRLGSLLTFMSLPSPNRRSLNGLLPRCLLTESTPLFRRWPQMKGLTSTIKQALWGPNKKRFHCWPLACSILYRAHCMDVKSALVYNHVTWMCEALNEVGTWDLYQDLIHGARRLKPRGPAQLLDQLLTELGGAITPDKRLDLGRFGIAPLGEKKALTHNLRQCLRHRLLDLACTKRRHLDLGGSRVDINRSTQLYRQQHVKHRSGLVTLLTDGAITQERLHHMGDGVDDQCSFCGRAREGIRHVLWGV